MLDLDICGPFFTVLRMAAQVVSFCHAICITLIVLIMTAKKEIKRHNVIKMDGKIQLPKTLKKKKGKGILLFFPRYIFGFQFPTTYYDVNMDGVKSLVLNNSIKLIIMKFGI